MRSALGRAVLTSHPRCPAQDQLLWEEALVLLEIFSGDASRPLGSPLLLVWVGVGSAAQVLSPCGLCAAEKKAEGLGKGYF